MPGPGLDVVGDEELAEVREVIESRRLGRYGPDDASFPAKVRQLEEDVAALAGARYALTLLRGDASVAP